MENINQMNTIYTVWSNNIKKETAPYRFCKEYVKKNILNGIKILVILSDDLHCPICGIISRNYKSKGSLAYHLQFDHFDLTVDHIINKILTMEPNKLQENIAERERENE